MRCPACRTDLVKEVGPAGVTFACPTCRGRSVGMTVLRRRFEKGAVNDLWRRARGATRRGERPCPACGLPMAEVGVHRGERETVVDACSFCFLLWFDFDELEMLPEKPAAPEPWKPSPRAAEATARMEIARANDDFVEEIDPWSHDGLPGRLGLPQKYGAPEKSVVPWVTWVLVAAMTVASAIPVVRGFGTWVRKAVHDAALLWGFVPADPFRLHGATWVTSFFLHGSFLHLLGNAYFLVLAGEDVEGLLGRGRYLLLLLLSTVAGEALHMALEPTSTLPLIGASGGISGVLAWYAFAFPKVRVGVVMQGLRSIWMGTWYRVRIPVRWMLFLWLLMQFSGAVAPRWFQLSPTIAYGAHVGGSLVGVAWWAIDRRRVSRAAEGVSGNDGH